MKRSELVAALVAKRGITEAEANALIDAGKKPPAPAPKEAPAPQKVPPKAAAPQKASAKATLAPQKTAPAKVAPKVAEPVDVTDVGTYAAPAPYGLGGARHRMEDREDDQFVRRNSYFGKPESAEDLALAIGNRAADDYAKREQVRGSLYNEMTRLGDARRAAIDAQVEARRDPLAEEISGAAKTRADLARVEEMNRKNLAEMERIKRDAAAQRAASKGDTYDLTGPTITQNGKPLPAKGKSAKQKLIDANVDPAIVNDPGFSEEAAARVALEMNLR